MRSTMAASAERDGGVTAGRSDRTRGRSRNPRSEMTSSGGFRRHDHRYVMALMCIVRPTGNSRRPCVYSAANRYLCKELEWRALDRKIHRFANGHPERPESFPAVVESNTVDVIANPPDRLDEIAEHPRRALREWSP